jgi:hypothetical protein
MRHSAYIIQCKTQVLKLAQGEPRLIFSCSRSVNGFPPSFLWSFFAYGGIPFLQLAVPELQERKPDTAGKLV